MAKVHLIGNAHLDPARLWRWQEGYSEVLATFCYNVDSFGHNAMMPQFLKNSCLGIVTDTRTAYSSHKTVK